MDGVLFILVNFILNLVWFVFYLFYFHQFPWKKILIFFAISFAVITWLHGKEYFLNNTMYIIFCATLLGGGISGFIEYLKSLYENYKNGSLSLKLMLPLIFYMWVSVLCIGAVQD